jgi:hypothetical protein
VGTTWLAYGTTAFRPLVRAEPLRFVVVPIAILAGCLLVLLPADDALPWSRADRLIGLAIGDYLLVTYHFASQHFGALSLYRARGGAGRLPSQRRWDRLFALLVGGALVILAEIVAGTVYYQDVWVDPWIDPDWVARWADPLRVGASLLVGAGTLGMLLLEWRAPRPSLPRALYVVGLAGLVLLAFHVQRPFLFIAAWSVQHWLLATGLATRVAAGEPPPRGGGLPRALHAIHRRPWAFAGVLALLSVALLPLLEVEATGPDDPHYADRIFGGFAVALRTSTWVPLLLALGFTTAFLHYWLDRACYRFSDPAVRAAAGGLLQAPTPRA